MFSPSSDPDDVIRFATPILIVVHNAFEAAAIKALEFFVPRTRGRGKRGEIDPASVNSSLYSALVRYYVKTALNDKGMDASEEEQNGIDPRDIPYDVDNLPNNGLLLKYGDFEFRIRKRYYGRLPNPATAAMQQFYQQRLPFETAAADALKKLHLMILWSSDSHFRFSRLDLVLPTDGDPKFSEWEWRRKVPHPALLLEGRTMASDEEDPPYRKKKADTGTDPKSE
jgi:hypothetical protein